MQENMMTIDQVSQLLNVSRDTVRRRIKAGELQAEKHNGPYGEQWMLPEAQFDQARMIQDVVPVTRSVTVAELHGVMQKVMAETVAQAVQAETKALTDQIEELKRQLSAGQSTQENQYRAIGDRLDQIAESNKKPFWQRLFGQ